MIQSWIADLGFNATPTTGRTIDTVAVCACIVLNSVFITSTSKFDYYSIINIVFTYL